MSNITPLVFESHNVTVITDAEAMTCRLDNDGRQNRRIVGFGNRGVTGKEQCND